MPAICARNISDVIFVTLAIAANVVNSMTLPIGGATMPNRPTRSKIGLWITATAWIISVAGVVYVYEIHF